MIAQYWTAIVAWFPSEVILALTSILIAAAIDAGLTAMLALRGKLGEPFSWRKFPQFLVTNVLWPAIGLIVGGALVKYYPDLKEGYFAVTAALDIWLAKDWRVKFNVLVGIKIPETLTGPSVKEIAASVQLTEPVRDPDALATAIAEHLKALGNGEKASPPKD